MFECDDRSLVLSTSHLAVLVPIAVQPQRRSFRGARNTAAGTVPVKPQSGTLKHYAVLLGFFRDCHGIAAHSQRGPQYRLHKWSLGNSAATVGDATATAAVAVAAASFTLDPAAAAALFLCAFTRRSCRRLR